tara:strand:+ start:4883 stop:8359 length:3477 start_codon:yes stop_codon:yes gene_type:complete
MVSPSQEQIRAQIDKLLPEYAPGGKFARGEQGSFKDFAKEQAEGMKRAGIGVAVGIPAIPSDIIELNKLVNDLAIRYGSKNISSIATSVQPQVDFLQKKFGRDKFDNMLNSIGISSDASDPAQMTGEIISGFLSGKTLVKGIQTGLSKIKPSKSTAIAKPKQTALSTKVDDTAPKDPSRRKFMQGVAGTAGAITAAPFIKVLPTGSVLTNVQKSYESLMPFVQNFRASDFNFDVNLRQYSNEAEKAKSIGSFTNIAEGTDGEGNKAPGLFTIESSKQPVDLNKQQENLIKNKETLALETEKHLKLLHNEKRKIATATRIPLEDIHVVKGVDTVDDMSGPEKATINDMSHFDEDIRYVDSLNNTYDAIDNRYTGSKLGVVRYDNSFYDSPLTDPLKKIKNQAFILPDGNVVDNVTRLKKFRESINVSKANISKNFNHVFQKFQQELENYDVMQGEYPILMETLKGKITADDIKSFEFNTGKKFPYKQFRTFFDTVFKDVHYLGTKQGFRDELRQEIFKQRIYTNVYSFDKGTQDIQKELDILNFMRLLSNKDSPLFNNLTDNQVLFIKDFFHPTQTPLRNTMTFQFSTQIPDVLNNKIRRAIKPLRTDVIDSNLKNVDEAEGLGFDYSEFDLDTLQEYTGTSMYHSFQEGLPTRKELINFDKLSESQYFYEMEKKLDNLISIPSKNKASVFRSVKLLNEVLDTINNNFFPVKGEGMKKDTYYADLYRKARGIQNLLENHLFRLVKNFNIPIDKARDKVNTSFKDSLLYSYYNRMNVSDTVPEDFQKTFGTEGLDVLKKLTEQFKKLDNMFPTEGLENQIYTKFLKANKQIPKNRDMYDPDTQGYYPSGDNAIRELDSLPMPENLLKGIDKIDKVTDQTTKMLKGADKAMTALEAPKVKYTKDVYHLGKGEIKGDKFNLMGESDFGIHVGTKGQAETLHEMKYKVQEGDVTNKPTLDVKGQTYKALGQRTFPLQIADDLKPARIPDIESFKMPQKWIAHLAVASDDKAGMDYMTQTTEAKLDLKNRPKVEYKGVTYYMSDRAAEMNIKNYDPKLNQSMVREKMDEQLWKDLVLSALEEETRLKGKFSYVKDRKKWFNKIKEVANKNGYDSFIYRNDKEQDQLDMYADSYMLLEQDQVKYKSSKTKTKGNPRLDKHKGGMI